MTTADAEREARERAEGLLAPCISPTLDTADCPRLRDRLTAAFLSDARERDELRARLEARSKPLLEEAGVVLQNLASDLRKAGYQYDDERDGDFHEYLAGHALTSLDFATIQARAHGMGQESAAAELAEARARAEAAEAAVANMRGEFERLKRMASSPMKSWDAGSVVDATRVEDVADDGIEFARALSAPTAVPTEPGGGA